jgi:hypothetical protein
MKHSPEPARMPQNMRGYVKAPPQVDLTVSNPFAV